MPVSGEAEILVKVSAWGVCHIELYKIENRSVSPGLPIILGHEIIGRIEESRLDIIAAEKYSAAI